MSFNEEETHRGKKRRLARACDACRRRKARCDGSQIEGYKCSTCLDLNLECTYLEASTVPLAGRHLFGQATLYDLQYHCLAVQFLERSSAAHGPWNIIGIALRFAQDLGIHRRSAHIEQPSVEREQFKRAFLILVYQDRIVSSIMGRPCALQHDDFDVALPIECDDEYWEHPTHPFQQPPGIPSRITFFNALMALNHILAFSLKLLYSLGKVRDVLSAVDESWEENTVAELDSALNTWRDLVPEHLHWDPERVDSVFFDQSVALQCGYHYLQVLIHRPFIPMMRTSAPTAIPSLAICTSAARSCANIVDLQRRRKGDVAVVFNSHAVFTSAMVLLLNVWAGKRTGMPDPTREMVNVQKCIDVTKLSEDRWQYAGIFGDIVTELASVGRTHSASDNQSHGLPRQHLSRTSSTASASESSQRRALHLQPHPQPIPASFADGINPVDLSAMEPNTFEADTWNPQDPLTGMHIPVSSQNPSESEDVLMNLIDQETIALWATAPFGLEVDDWENYFNNFGELTHME